MSVFLASNSSENTNLWQTDLLFDSACSLIIFCFKIQICRHRIISFSRLWVLMIWNESINVCSLCPCIYNPLRIYSARKHKMPWPNSMSISLPSDCPKSYSSSCITPSSGSAPEHISQPSTLLLDSKTQKRLPKLAMSVSWTSVCSKNIGCQQMAFSSVRTQISALISYHNSKSTFRLWCLFFLASECSQPHMSIFSAPEHVSTLTPIHKFQTRKIPCLSVWPPECSKSIR